MFLSDRLFCASLYCLVISLWFILENFASNLTVAPCICASRFRFHGDFLIKAIQLQHLIDFMTWPFQLFHWNESRRAWNSMQPASPNWVLCFLQDACQEQGKM